MCLISPTFLPLSRFRCFPFPLLVSGSPDSHVCDPAYGRGAIARAAAANSQTLALSACVYPRLRKSTQCSCRCLQSTQALCSDSRWTERQRGCLSGFIQHMRRYLNKVFWNVSFLHPFASLLRRLSCGGKNCCTSGRGWMCVLKDFQTLWDDRFSGSNDCKPFQ